MKDKFLKKVAGWYGYKLVDKDLIKNNRIIGDKSFLNIERILKYLIKNNLIKSLVQIGANDGQRFDVLNSFIKEYKIKCILVEPIKEHFEELKKNYKNFNNIFFENSLISVNNEIFHLYKVDTKYLNQYSDHVSGISSFDYKHLIKHGVKKKHIIKQKINSISLNELLLKYNYNNFDLLFVDVEGYDGKIIDEFLTSSPIRPYIIFEYIHINNKMFKNLTFTLQKSNYIFFPLKENVICIPKEKELSFIFQNNF